MEMDSWASGTSGEEQEYEEERGYSYSTDIRSTSLRLIKVLGRCDSIPFIAGGSYIGT
jgi:hypothetical protein